METRSQKKGASVREGGTELVRGFSELEGFEGISERITAFYLSLSDKAISGALELLAKRAKNEFMAAKEAGHISEAFFKRYNYNFLCRAEHLSEKYVKIDMDITLKRGREKIYSVKNVHFWNIEDEYMLSKNGIKKALSGEKRLLKNEQW